ncbi:MAG: AAA family ATPase [Treponema sp.]|nr:AAA family ATPase [Treponema sp.]
MATIKDLKRKLRLVLRKPEGGMTFVQPITPFIWGKSGIGKSQAVKQIAEEYGIGFIDLRLSQLESADMRGIPVPDMEQHISKWLPPEFLPFEGIDAFKGTSGILLLDEFNRARPDVLQAAFQLVLDRQVGMHRLLASWFIVAAGNLGDQDNTDVVEMDAALKNRFIHFTIDVDVDAWIEWAEIHGINDAIIDFLRHRPHYLYYVAHDEDRVFVTPRSWEKFSGILAQNSSVDPAEITALLGPDIISAVAAPFIKYLELRQMVSGIDIVTRYKKSIALQHTIKVMQRDQLYSLNDAVIDALITLETVELQHLENVHAYLNTVLEKDMYVAFLRTLTKKCIDRENVFIDRYLQTYSEEAKALITMLKETG